MPRKSAAALATRPAHEPDSPLRPPSDLSPAGLAVWEEIAGCVPPGHFRVSDFSLLRAYCEAAGLAGIAAGELAADGAVVDGRVSPWVGVLERAHRSMASLALRLRLCPSSRLDPKVVGRQRDVGLDNIDFGRLSK